MVAIVLVGRRPKPRLPRWGARLCRRCRSGGRCIARTIGRTRRSCKAGDHPRRRGSAGPHPRPWLTLFLPTRMCARTVRNERKDPDMVVRNRRACSQRSGQQELQIASERRHTKKQQKGNWKLNVTPTACELEKQGKTSAIWVRQ